MNANHIFVAAIQDVAEILGQFCQEAFIERLVCPNGQTLQFLDIATLGAQAALGNALSGPDQVAAMLPLGFAHMVQ